MYITLNCDFHETEFFYTSQHSGQGENDYVDPLDWLKWAPMSMEVNTFNTQDKSPTSLQSNAPIIGATNQDLPSPLIEVSNSQFNKETPFNVETHGDIQHNETYTDTPNNPECHIEQIVQEEPIQE